MVERTLGAGPGVVCGGLLPTLLLRAASFLVFAFYLDVLQILVRSQGLGNCFNWLAASRRTRIPEFAECWGAALSQSVYQT